MMPGDISRTYRGPKTAEVPSWMDETSPPTLPRPSQPTDDQRLIQQLKEMATEFAIDHSTDCKQHVCWLAADRLASANAAWLLLHRWENIAKNGGEKWLREHPLVAETTKLLNDEVAANTAPSETSR